MSKTIKYLVKCHINRLKLNKSIEFETKIVWKRNQNKTQTNTVKHMQGYSTFNQLLTLQFNLVYNPQIHAFEQKNTEFVAVITYQGKIKSGGCAKYNITHDLNQRPNEITKINVPLAQCPDPNAFIEMELSYEKINEMEDDEPSIMNITSNELSRIDFHDDRISQEIFKINDITNKFNELASKTKKKKSQQNDDPLKNKLIKLEKKLELKDSELETERKKAQKQLKDLEKRIHLKENDSEYKGLYEEALQEIKFLKENTVMSKSETIQSEETSSLVRQEEEISRQNIELKIQIASLTHKVAQLFNASFEYGGPKLLDFLQSSIGLTEQNN